MYKTTTIKGYAVHLLASKDGSQVRSAVVILGPPDQPGWRLKDFGAAQPRREARLAVAEALGLPLDKVSASARYSCLRQRDDGLIERRADSGRVLGVHRP